jgi:hypothetical protein
MCWGFEISFRDGKSSEPTFIFVDDIERLRDLYKRYGKDMPDAVFNDDYFEPGKRVPISELKERSCLCPTNKKVILDFVAGAFMNELDGIADPTTPAQIAVRDAIAGMIDTAIDGLKTTRFAGHGKKITVSWI